MRQYIQRHHHQREEYLTHIHRPDLVIRPERTEPADSFYLVIAKHIEQQPRQRGGQEICGHISEPLPLFESHFKSNYSVAVNPRVMDAES